MWTSLLISPSRIPCKIALVRTLTTTARSVEFQDPCTHRRVLSICSSDLMHLFFFQAFKGRLVSPRYGIERLRAVTRPLDRPCRNQKLALILLYPPILLAPGGHPSQCYVPPIEVKKGERWTATVHYEPRFTRVRSRS